VGRLRAESDEQRRDGHHRRRLREGHPDRLAPVLTSGPGRFGLTLRAARPDRSSAWATGLCPLPGQSLAASNPDLATDRDPWANPWPTGPLSGGVSLGPSAQPRSGLDWGASRIPGDCPPPTGPGRADPPRGWLVRQGVCGNSPIWVTTTAEARPMRDRRWPTSQARRCAQVGLTGARSDNRRPRARRGKGGFHDWRGAGTGYGNCTLGGTLDAGGSSQVMTAALDPLNRDAHRAAIALLSQLANHSLDPRAPENDDRRRCP
jgi:hypothetical protein